MRENALHRRPIAGTATQPVPSGGTRAFWSERGGDRHALYGYGKVALRDSIDLCRTIVDGTNVVLPAYVPDGVVEPFREAGLEPRFHRITPELGADLSDVEELVDEETFAIVSVHYFGFPQPAIEELRDLADTHDAALIDDGAHATLSTSDGRLLGTLGNVGITSFRKLLTVPDGAALFVTDDRLSDDAITRSAVRTRPTLGDANFVGQQVLETAGLLPSIRRTFRSFRSSSDDNPSQETQPRSPAQRYEDVKKPMSWYSLRVLDRTEPATVIEKRRRTFLRWQQVLSGIDGVHPVYEDLPEGVCPQRFPVLVEDESVLSEVTGTGSDQFDTWPRLPSEVRGNDRYVVSHQCSEQLVPLETDPDRITGGMRSPVRVRSAIERERPSL